MKQAFFSVLFLLLVSGILPAQAISINTDGSNADPSAILDVKSTNKGVLVPRMTTLQRSAIAAPARGLLVFDTTTDSFWFYTGTAWTNLSAATFIADTDGDTKIQTEENLDEDIIRLDLAGSERLVLKRNTGGATLLELPNNLNNTFLGTGTGNANTTGKANVAIGVAALNKSATRSNLVAVGDSALYNNSVGALELYHGTVNTALGSKALFANTIGDANTATGNKALYANTSGYSNTGTGAGALLSNSTGYANTAFGAATLSTNTTGSNNTALGFNADVQTANLTNATAIGANASVNASNCLVLGSINGINGATSSVKVGIGVTIPTHYLTISAPDDETLRLIGPGTNGAGSRFNFGDADFTYIEETTDDIMRIQANRIGVGRPPTTNRLEVEGEASKSTAGSWLANSDARLKKNIQPLNSAETLKKLLALQGITYEWNDDKTGSWRPEGIQYGFTAQNIQTVFPTLVEEDKLGYLQTAYGTYDAMTVEAIRALHDEIEALKAENAVMKAQLDKITAALQTAGIGVK